MRTTCCTPSVRYPASRSVIHDERQLDRSAASRSGASGPAVSVVVATYNRRALLMEALDCVRSQTHRDFELLVVDDGSTDGTADAVEERFSGDPRVRVRRKENGGTASARNAGIAAARAPWTAFIDSDDLWEPGYLASQLAALAAQPRADMVVGDVTYVNQPRTALSMFADSDFHAPTSLEQMCAGAWALPSAMVVRTGILQAIGFTDNFSIIEDTEFLFRFHAGRHRCILNAERLVSWRRPEGESARSKSESGFEVEVEMLALLRANRRLSRDPEAVERRLFRRHRIVAWRLVRERRYREARPHLLAWSQAKPKRWRPRLYYLLSLASPRRS